MSISHSQTVTYVLAAASSLLLATSLAEAQTPPFTLPVSDNGVIDRAQVAFGTVDGLSHVGDPGGIQHQTYQAGFIAHTFGVSEARPYFIFDTTSVPAGATQVSLRLWMFDEMLSGAQGSNFELANNSVVAGSNFFRGYIGDATETLEVYRVQQSDVVGLAGADAARMTAQGLAGYISGLLPYGRAFSIAESEQFSASHLPLFNALAASVPLGGRVFSAADASPVEPNPVAPLTANSDCSANFSICGQWIEIPLPGLAGFVDSGQPLVLGAATSSYNGDGQPLPAGSPPVYESLFRAHFVDTTDNTALITAGFLAPPPELVFQFEEEEPVVLPVPVLGGNGPGGKLWVFALGIGMACVGGMSIGRRRRKMQQELKKRS